MSDETPQPPQTDATHSDAPPQANVATVTHIKRWSPVWLVPLLAFGIGLWMVYANYASQGPVIEIRFDSADGIEPDKTKVRTKSVEIGEVLGMRLSDNAQSVILSVRIHKESEHLLHKDSKFWIVRPRVSLLGVTGLGTLLSGAYIEMEPGSKDADRRRFKGLDAPPETPSGTPGLHLILESDSSKHLHAGTPVMFGGMNAGKIEDVDFDPQTRRIQYRAFIVDPYDRLITENTRFWFNSGVAANISADGLRLEFGTLETIAEGGISFGVPEGQPLGSPITDTHPPFAIYPYEEAIYEPIYRNTLEYIILADKSIRGLTQGAPVEYRGVKIGEVSRIDIDYDDEDILLMEPGSRIPILMTIEPARIGYEDTDQDAEIARARIQELIRGGLHGEIKTTNYVTGAKIIDIQHLNRRTLSPQTFGGYTVIPTAEGQVDQLLVLLEATAKKVNDLPLQEVTDDTLATLAKAQDTLDHYQRLADDYASGSEPHRELIQSLQSLERTLAEVTPLIREVRQQPNRLIVGPRDTPDAEPTGANP